MVGYWVYSLFIWVKFFLETIEASDETEELISKARGFYSTPVVDEDSRWPAWKEIMFNILDVVVSIVRYYEEKFQAKHDSEELLNVSEAEKEKYYKNELKGLRTGLLQSIVTNVMEAAFTQFMPFIFRKILKC